MKTPISYYGGKQSIIRHILPLIPDHEVYTEVFFGGGTIFFAKNPAKNETINDRLDIVINFYKILKSNFTDLKKLIDETLISRTQHKQALKILHNTLYYSNLEKAWAFWFCSNFSYSNKIGGGLKYSNDKSVCAPQVLQNNKKRFTEELVRRIENATIECNDALFVLNSRNVINAFHYIDPPYVFTDQGQYKGYGIFEYTNLLMFLERIKGKFLLSSYNSDILSKFIEKNGWNKKEIIHRIKASRKTGPVKCEVLIWNYNK